MRPQWLDEYQNKYFEKFKYRNLNGTFAKGNPGGPGRPKIDYLKRAGIYRKVPLEEMSPEIREVSIRAEHGDFQALKFIRDSLKIPPGQNKTVENRKNDDDNFPGAIKNGEKW